MNEPFDTIGDEPIEARIVAWVLGEASAFEAAELERLCDERPELLVFQRRMRSLHSILTETQSSPIDDSWKLPDEKRKALEEIFGEEKVVRLEPDREIRVRRSGRRALLAIAACVILSLSIFPFLPKEFESEAIIEIKPQNGAILLEGSQSASAFNQPLTPQFFGTEFGKIKSRSSLEKVITNLNLAERWGVDKESALKLLKKSVTTENVKGTDLISIRARNAKGEDAKDITAEVVKAYKAYRTEIESRDAEKSLFELNKAIRDQEDKMEERRKVLATIVRTKGIIYKGQDSFYGASGVNGGAGEEAIRRGLDAQDYVDAKRDFETDQQLLQQMKLKQIAGTISAKMGHDSIEVIDQPEITSHVAIPFFSKMPAAAQLASNDRASDAAGEKKVASLPAPQPELAVESSKPRAVPSQAQASASIDQGGAARFSNSEIPPSNAPAVDLAKAKKALASGEIGQSSRNMSSSAASSDVDAILNNPEGKEEMKNDHGTVAGNGSFNNSDGVGQGFGGGKGSGAPSMSQPKSEARRGGAMFQPPAPTRELTSNITESETASGLPLGSNESPGQGIADKSNLGIDPKDSRSEAKQIENKEDPSFSDLAGKSSETGAIALGDRAQDPFSKQDEDLKPSDPAAPKSVDLAGVSDLSFQTDVAQPPIQTLLESIEEIATVEEPYSTFSLNINDASFQIAKAALEKGNRPDPTGIKVEQFYNAVDYGDPAPVSNEPVAATIEQSAHPIIPGRNLVRVALKTAASGRGASQPLRLTLLVDQSGSMIREDRRAAMANALKQLGGLLTPNDHLTVIGFSRESHLLADGITGDQSEKLSDLINQTASEGGTNFEEALKLGEQMAARHHISGEQNRIVLFTDGAANLGDAKPERLAERVKSMRQKGIAFDIAGIGADGLNDRLLSELARNGNGRYYVVSDEKNDSFARQLAGAFRPAAENVKVQVHFNPERIGRYKLIGFEKDRLKTEDFRNDAVDAAELAAEEAGVAIYQVETLPQGTGEIGEVSVRFRDTAKDEMVERTWTIPFESSTQPFDRATPAMQLAGLSMLAADKLRGGPLADAIDFKQLSGPKSLVKQFYGNSTRVAEMLWLIGKLE